MSHDLLDDLLADVPRHVVPDAGGAWRAGTRRRRRRYAAEGVAIAAAVALVGVALIRLHDHTPVGPAGHAVTVKGHPESVPRPFVQADLPAAPGPLAGVLDMAEGWQAVDQDGRTWRLPATPANFYALSDDGTRLGFLREEGPARGHYETIDLVSGEVQSYPTIGTGTTTNDIPLTDQPYWASEQFPSYWSPDGAHLVVSGGSMSESWQGALLLEDGHVHEVRAQGWPVGWGSSTTLVWLSYGGRQARITDLSGNVLRSVTLETPPRLRGFSQWSGRVSPDGTTLVVVGDPDLAESRAATYSLETGAIDQTWLVDEASDQCPPMWDGDEVAMWHDDRLADLHGDTVITLGDRWAETQTACGAWAADALAGPTRPGPGLTEWRYWPFLWWWPWVLGLVVGSAVALVVWRHNRRFTRTGPRSGPTPGAPSPPTDD